MKQTGLLVFIATGIAVLLLALEKMIWPNIPPSELAAITGFVSVGATLIIYRIIRGDNKNENSDKK